MSFELKQSFSSSIFGRGFLTSRVFPNTNGKVANQMSDSKATIYDVAKYLGVSATTVNRAINDKPNVSDKMKQRVREAVEALGYSPSKTAAALSRKPVNISIIFPINNVEFLEDVLKGIENALDELKDYNFYGEIYKLKSDYSIKDYIKAMYDCAEKGVDAILLVCPKPNSIITAAMEDIAERGIKFGVALAQINNPSNNYNVQINGRIAGSMAAEFLSDCLLPGSKVAMVTGSLEDAEHFATVEGFKETIKNTQLINAGIYEHDDDPIISGWVAERILKNVPDIAGIYIGTAVSAVFCKKVQEMGYSGKIKIIASDIFPELSELMENHTVMASIFKKPYQTGHKLVSLMFEQLVNGNSVTDKFQYLVPEFILNSNKLFYLHNGKNK